jgi:hypothetical protein
MFGKLPDLFGKAFAIGFFLPAAVIAAGAAGILAVYGDFDAIQGFVQEDKTLGSTVALAGIWLLSIVLMALNNGLIRLLEGYGRANPFRVVGKLQRRRYDALTREVRDIEATLRAAPDLAATERMTARRAVILRRLAVEFPDAAEHLLPTRLGNIIRAFEVYPRVIYRLEGIQGWSRLVGIIPAEYQAAVDEAKAQMDFWLNLFVGGMLLILLHFAWAWRHGFFGPCWIPLVCLAVSLTAYILIHGAAIAWGSLVTSAFDLYRGELCKKLGFTMPLTIEHERVMWTAVSQVAVYRSAEVAESFNPFRSGKTDDTG